MTLTNVLTETVLLIVSIEEKEQGEKEFEKGKTLLAFCTSDMPSEEQEQAMADFEIKFNKLTSMKIPDYPTPDYTKETIDKTLAELDNLPKDTTPEIDELIAYFNNFIKGFWYTLLEIA